jgi:hypothetical protein
MADKDIATIPKNQETEIVIRMDDFGGKRGITIREFVKSERYTGFTKAGTRIPAEYFKIFKDAINSIDEKELAKPAETQPTARPSGSGGFGNKSSSFSKGSSAKKPKEESEEDFGDMAF